MCQKEEVTTAQQVCARVDDILFEKVEPKDEPRLVLARIPRKRRVGAQVELLLNLRVPIHSMSKTQQLVEAANERNLLEPGWIYWIVPMPPYDTPVSTDFTQESIAKAEKLQLIATDELLVYGIWSRKSGGKGYWAGENDYQLGDRIWPRFYRSLTEALAVKKEMKSRRTKDTIRTIHRIELPIPGPV